MNQTIKTDQLNGEGDSGNILEILRHFEHVAVRNLAEGADVDEEDFAEVQQPLDLQDLASKEAATAAVVFVVRHPAGNQL